MTDRVLTEKRVKTTMQLLAAANLRVRELEEQAAYLEKALRKITRREGQFSRNHHTHAENTIDDMAGVAEAALKGEEWDD